MADIEMANDEGAGSATDINEQDPDEAMSTPEARTQGATDDPHKVEKLARAGRPDFDPDAGSD
jgi:hypothetical protein